MTGWIFLEIALDLELLEVATSIGDVHYSSELRQGEPTPIINDLTISSILCQTQVAVVVLQCYLEC